MKQYPGKVILFGEYSMISDSRALLVPVHRFSAHWAKEENLSFSRKELFRFLEYLKDTGTFQDRIDLDAFEKDLHEGWALASSLPMGYGLGSSGTVVAGVYDRYGLVSIKDPLELRNLFAEMESFFHGKSSGIDPLESFLGKPFRISSEALELLSDDILDRGISVCLFDTKTERKTKPLVEYFHTMQKDPVYREGFEQEYLPLVQACMDTLIDNHQTLFFEVLQKFSRAQLKYFRPMIPQHTMPFFEQVCDFNFGVKILGAGGGGYLLGFTDDREKASELLREYNVLWLNQKGSDCETTAENR